MARCSCLRRTLEATEVPIPRLFSPSRDTTLIRLRRCRGMPLPATVTNLNPSNSSAFRWASTTLICGFVPRDPSPQSQVQTRVEVLKTSDADRRGHHDDKGVPHPRLRLVKVYTHLTHPRHCVPDGKDWRARSQKNRSRSGRLNGVRVSTAWARCESPWSSFLLVIATL